MAVGVLLITHDKIGKSLLSVSSSMLGKQTLKTAAIHVSDNCNVEKVTRQALAKRNKLDQGEGVLILTDVYGATPCNIAREISDSDETIVVSGVNLPMLIRVMNYAKLPLPKLAEKAISGGHNGIFLSADADLDGKHK